MLKSNLNNNEFITELLEQNIRLDGRQTFQSRTLQAQFMDNYGSLLFCQGNTKVLIKVNSQITAPKAQRPSEGFIIFKVNCNACMNTASENRKLSNEMVKLLEKIVIGSNALDPQSLCILTGKFVWQLVVECVIVKDNGNIYDAILNGTMLALMDMRKPLVNVQNNQVKVSEKKLVLSLAHTPFSLTFGLINNTIFLDPSLSEQKSASTRMTVSMNIYNQICSIHKPGGKGVTENVLSGIMKVCEGQIKGMTEFMRSAVKQRKSIRQMF